MFGRLLILGNSRHGLLGVSSMLLQLVLSVFASVTWSQEAVPCVASTIPGVCKPTE